MISTHPTAEEKVQYAAWLADAEAACHRLMTGAQEVSTSFDGESVTYSQASLPKLKAYIADLRRALGKAPLRNQGVAFKSVTFGSPRRRGGLI